MSGRPQSRKPELETTRALATTASADVGIRATRVIAVSDQRRAVEPTACASADQSRDPVAAEPDQPANGERKQMGRFLRVNQTSNRLHPGDGSRGEDCRDDEQPGNPLCSTGTEQECNPKRDRRTRVAKIVDQVGEEGNAAAGEENRQLSRRGHAEDGQRQPDSLQALTGAFDARVNQAVRVPMALSPAIVGVRAVMVVRMGQPPVPMQVAAQLFICPGAHAPEVRPASGGFGSACVPASTAATTYTFHP